jgi:hypothetical protein
MFAGLADPDCTSPLTRASPMLPHPRKQIFVSINRFTPASFRGFQR